MMPPAMQTTYLLWPRYRRGIYGKCRESDEMMNSRFSWIFSSTARTKSSLTTDGPPLRGSSCTCSRLSLKCLTHLLLIESRMACSPHASQSWRWLSAGFMFLVFKKRITVALYMRRDSRFPWTLQTHITMRKRGSIVCLPKGPTNSVRMRTNVTAALQRQYLQTELILWIRLVLWISYIIGKLCLRGHHKLPVESDWNVQLIWRGKRLPIRAPVVVKARFISFYRYGR
jgi:hypothetical protein